MPIASHLASENRESLQSVLQRKLQGHKFVLVSNREPHMNVYHDGRIGWALPASGMSLALDPVMQVSHGLWVAHGSGPADREVSDPGGYVCVPPEHPTYRLKRVWLTQEQEDNYYYGFANSALWPLCHVVYRRPIFRREHWESYRQVNRLFAEEVAQEIGDERALVFVQDYHFALLPRMLRELCPNAVIAQFWHIPWPNREVFRICPWRQEILDGMLGNDLLGFHIRNHVQNFIDTVAQELESRPDRELTAIVSRGHMTRIRAFPISVDFESISQQAAAGKTQRRAAALRRRFRIGSEAVMIASADRLDYTKGIPERLEAIDRFLEKYPCYQGRVVFFQVAVPSRTGVEEYRRLDEEVTQRVSVINGKYARDNWQPVIFIRDSFDKPTMLALFRASDIFIVSSLHDGMNLVAKEFVAARVKEDGVLILSRFTGAARELRDAVITNPFAPDEMAESIYQALQMEPAAARRRMRHLREQVRDHNVYKWASSILGKITKLT